MLRRASGPLQHGKLNRSFHPEPAVAAPAGEICR